MSAVVVNCAFGNSSWYPRGLERLAARMRLLAEPGVVFEGWDHEPPGLTHARVPYWFKPKMLIEAAARNNRRFAVWMDAAAVPTGPLAPFLRAIEQQGVWAQFGGHWCGRWTNENCLRDMNLTRTEADTIPMVMACVVGFDLDNPAALSLLHDWRRWAEQSSAFCGSWSDHRHDQSVLSILMHRAGIRCAPPLESGQMGVSYGAGSGGLIECYPA